MSNQQIPFHKWDTFLSITKERVLHQIKSRDIRLPDIEGPDVYENLVMTVIEDGNMLEGADIKTTTNKFEEWLRTAGLDELREMGEMQDTDVENLEGEEFWMNLPAIPRWLLSFHHPFLENLRFQWLTHVMWK